MGPRIRTCCVPNCVDKKFRRYRIPQNKKQREIWLERIFNCKPYELDDNMKVDQYTVCGIHFDKKCVKEDTKLMRYALPSKYLPGFTETGELSDFFSETMKEQSSSLANDSKERNKQRTVLGASPPVDVMRPMRVYEKKNTPRKLVTSVYKTQPLASVVTEVHSKRNISDEDVSFKQTDIVSSLSKSDKLMQFYQSEMAEKIKVERTTPPIKVEYDIPEFLSDEYENNDEYDSEIGLEANSSESPVKVPIPSNNFCKRPKIQDHLDVYVRNIKMRLLNLPKTQQLLAERIINETLLKAEHGTLTTSHILVDRNIANDSSH